MHSGKHFGTQLAIKLSREWRFGAFRNQVGAGTPVSGNFGRLWDENKSLQPLGPLSIQSLGRELWHRYVYVHNFSKDCIRKQGGHKNVSKGDFLNSGHDNSKVIPKTTANRYFVFAFWPYDGRLLVQAGFLKTTLNVRERENLAIIRNPSDTARKFTTSL